MDVLGMAIKAAEMALGRRAASHARVIDYLQAVARSAALLASSWREIEQLLSADAESSTVSEVRSRERVVRALFGAQSKHHSTLDDFYRNLTTIVGKEVAGEYPGSFLFHLSSLLRLRETARTEAGAAIREVWKPVLLSTFEDRKPLTTLADAVAALEIEATTLENFVVKLRAVAS